MSNKIITLPYKFTPRWYQEPVFNMLKTGKKRGAVVWHRRCIAAGTKIAMYDGTIKNIEDILVGDVVCSYDGNKIVGDVVVDSWCSGEKECVTLNDSITTTKDHRFFSENDSWKEIKDARSVRCAAELPCGNVDAECLAEFLGLMVTDGSVTYNQTPKFTNTDREILDRLKELAKKEFPDVVIKTYTKGNGEDITLSSCNNGASRKKGHFLRQYFKDSNLMPDIVWSFDKKSTRAFLSGVIAGDGSFYIKETETPRIKKKYLSAQMVIEAGISKELAISYKAILQRFGVKSVIKKDNRSNNYRVFVYSTKSIRRLEGIKIPCAHKQEKFEEILRKTKPNKSCSYRIENKKRLVDAGVLNTYDIETEKFHNFIANGYIVHNCGKDKTLFNIMIKESQKRVGIYYYLFPTYKQGRKILWEGIDKDGFKFLDHIPKELIKKDPNNTEMKIEMKNGSIMQVVGTDSYDSVRGTNPVGCVFSEYSVQDPGAWDVIRPILLENGGWALFNWTPLGHNHAWELGEMAKNNPDWFYQFLTIDDTRVVTDEMIQSERDAGMTDDMIQQEYYCSYDAAARGAFYSNELARARKEGRICSIAVEKSVPVDAYFDLGYSDQTSIWLVQNIKGELRHVKYMSDSHHDIVWYINQIRDWRDENGCMIDKYIVPHDGNNHTTASVMSTYEILDDLGLNVEMVMRPTRKTQGIETVRKVFPRCWFNQSGCFKGIDLLAQYRAEFDATKGVQDQSPVHDLASHCADAFQTMALYNARDITIAPKDMKNRFINNLNFTASGSGVSRGGGWMV